MIESRLLNEYCIYSVELEKFLVCAKKNAGETHWYWDDGRFHSFTIREINNIFQTITTYKKTSKKFVLLSQPDSIVPIHKALIEVTEFKLVPIMNIPDYTNSIHFTISDILDGEIFEGIII